MYVLYVCSILHARAQQYICQYVSVGIFKENNLIKSEKAVGETPFSHVTSVVVGYFVHQGAPCSFCKHTNQLI